MKMTNWWKSGDPWIWLTAASVTISLVTVAGLLILIAMRGLGHFWPTPIFQAEYVEPSGKTIRLIGEIQDEELVSATQLKDSGLIIEGDWATRYLVKTGNRDSFGLDFRWVMASGIQNQRYPKDLMVVERREWGNFYGYLKTVKENGKVVSQGEAAWEELHKRLERALAISNEIRTIEKYEMGEINYGLEKLRLYQRRLELNNEFDAIKQAEIAENKKALNARFAVLNQKLGRLYQLINRDSFSAQIMDGRVVDIPLSKVVHVHRPNAMSLPEKLGFYAMKAWEFVSEDPREANTEGGIFPAIFGTVIMVIIMSIIVTPIGVIAAVYLHEYAKQGFLTSTIRIAVNNLAGVPSIVYGVFGLGFFVYFLGANIDQWFFPEALPAPTYGTPGILWASLTLALLTVPVVIVSTEEGLSRIPSSIREGSLALGATKAETLWRTVLPMASPAMMTGLILAIARAAGEVAPLMLVGVVKLAPSLVVDAQAPFLHLERKFMHLGFHIYDVGFQSPNVEAARPLVYATAFLLVAVIVILNLTAIWIRNNLREKYKALETA
jgi:phosphate transport system permease protein